MKYEYFQSKLNEISCVLENEINKTELIGVKTGLLGTSLFYFHLYEQSSSESHLKLAKKIVSLALKKLELSYHSRFLSMEISEIGWFLEYISQKEWVPIDTNELLSDLDDLMIQNLLLNLKNNEYDTCSGAINNGFYFLARIRAKEDLLEWISMLISNIANKDVVDSGCYLGISHGLAGTLMFLVKAYQLHIEREKCAKIINSLIENIISYYREENFPLNSFPVIAGEPIKNSHSLCWSYSDIGIGYAIYRGATLTKNLYFQEKALKILEISLNRRILSYTKSEQLGLWYGSSGVALTYLKIYDLTGNKSFKDGYEFWFEKTLSSCNEVNHLTAGFPLILEVGNDVNLTSCLIHGLPGIGLSFLSCINKKTLIEFPEFIFMI